jgi:hypothetical protein
MHIGAKTASPEVEIQFGSHVKKIIFIDSFRTAWSVRWPFISAKESMSLSPQILPHLSDIL